MKTTLFLGMLLLVFACGQPEATKPPADETNWARPGIQGGNSGAYFSYQNPLDVADTLLAITTDVAMTNEIHESYITEDGLSGMRPVNELIVEPGEWIQLQPGGLHLMMMGLKRELTIGDSLKVTLKFRQAGEETRMLPIHS